MVSAKRIHDRIVVGVDSSTAAQQAVLWAAAEARLRHGDLVITHVEPLVTQAVLLHDADVDRNQLLAASATAASTRQPGVAVGTVLLNGDITDQLLRLSKSAGVLVVGLDRTMSRASHGAAGPIEDRVVTHAWCPVVIVSERLPGDEAAHERVVVGVTADAEAVAVLNAAAAEAVLRRAELRVVVGRVDGSLQRAIDALVLTHPLLAVTAHHAAERLVQELERESRAADLMVVGCTQSEDRWSIRTGALSSVMTRAAHCPVMLVGHRAGGRTSEAQPAA